MKQKKDVFIVLIDIIAPYTDPTSTIACTAPLDLLIDSVLTDKANSNTLVQTRQAVQRRISGGMKYTLKCREPVYPNEKPLSDRDAWF